MVCAPPGAFSCRASLPAAQEAPHAWNSTSSPSASTSAIAVGCTSSGTTSSTGTWSDGALVTGFEERWSAWNGLPGGGDLELDGLGARGARVLRAPRQDGALPSNTFMASPLSVHSRPAPSSNSSTATVTTSACRSPISRRKVARHRPAAVILVHIGGHIAFEVEQIAALCRGRGHHPDRGLRARPRRRLERPQRAGTCGDAGLWSFAPTKTISTGEGGMLVSRHPDLIECARNFRNYGKPDYAAPGLNYRMNEFTAAIGHPQRRTTRGDRRLEERRVARDELDPIYPSRARVPRRDGLGLLQVHRLRRRSSARPARSTTSPATACIGHQVELPNTDWVAENHWCAPLYYRPPPSRLRVSHDEGRSSRAAPGSSAPTSSTACAPRPRAADPRPRPSPYHPESSSYRARRPARPRGRGRGADGCDAVAHLAADGGRQRGRRRPGAQTTVNVHGTVTRARGGTRRRDRAFVYASTIWVYGNAPRPRAARRGGPARPPRPSLHRHEARGRDVLPRLRGALRRRPHDPALRDPLRAARPRRAVLPLRRAVPAPATRSRSPATERRRGSSSTSKTSPTGSSPRSYPAAAGRVYNLVGDESVTVREIADTVRELVAPVPMVHGPSGPPTCAARDLGRARGEGARLAAPHMLRRRRRGAIVDWVTGTQRLPAAATASTHSTAGRRPSPARSRASCSDRRREGARRRPPGGRRRPRSDRLGRPSPPQSRPHRDQSSGSQPRVARARARRDEDAVRRPVDRRGGPGRFADHGERTIEVGREGRGPPPQEQLVPVAVQGDLVACRRDLGRKGRVALDLLADEEERCGCAGRRKHLEHRRRSLRVRPVVEGDGDAARLVEQARDPEGRASAGTTGAAAGADQTAGGPGRGAPFPLCARRADAGLREHERRSRRRQR